MEYMLAVGVAKVAMVQQDLERQERSIRDIEQEAREIARSLQDRWTGDDADAFQAEMANDASPKLLELAATVADLNAGLGKAVERIREADRTALRLLADLLERQSRAISRI